MNTLQRFFSCLLICTLWITSGAPAQCVAPDAGGTAAMPALCPFTAPLEPMHIIDGLPPGMSVDCAPTFDSFFDIFTLSGDPTIGETKTYQGTLRLVMSGMGGYAGGFSRTIIIPNVSFKTAYAPRTPGAPLQVFGADMQQVQGQIVGDPDFDLLRITAGSEFGLPSPGLDTLTQSGAQWGVESFFDLTYRIDFVGSSSGSFTGLSGSTTSTLRIRQGGPPNILLPTNNLPPDGKYQSDPGGMYHFPGPFEIRHLVSHNPSPQAPPPPPGGAPVAYSYSCQTDLDLSSDGGATWMPFVNVPTNAWMRVQPPTVHDSNRYYETELLSLNLTGGSLPPGVMLRESPTHSSPGITRTQSRSGGGFLVSSFFDIWVDFSSNGGVTWGASQESVHVHLEGGGGGGTPTGGICGNKWFDKNGDGVHDPDESGLPGWTIVLTLPDQSTISTVTGDGGSYCFPGLASGSYTVHEVAQSGWVQTGGLSVYTIILSPGQNVTGVDFGNTQTSAICGAKFNDLNGNGQKDLGEPGLPNWQICAAPSGGGNPLCVLTGEDGSYCFTGLLPGTYVVSETPQSGWTQTGPPGGSYSITVAPGVSAAGADFFNKSSSCHVCINIWYDGNHNQQPGDPDDTPLATEVTFVVTYPDASQENFTTASGVLCFDVPPGTSSIQELLPDGYTYSVPKTGLLEVTCDGRELPPIDWLNTAALTDSAFRTHSYLEWARTYGEDPKHKLKSIKCKPDKVDFKLNLKVPPLAGTNEIPRILDLKFSIPVDTVRGWLWKLKEIPLCGAIVRNDAKRQLWTVDLSNCLPPPNPGTPVPGDILQFDVRGLKPTRPKVEYQWHDQASYSTPVAAGILPRSPKFFPNADTLKAIFMRLPMPNLVNVGEDFQLKRGYFPFTTGAPADSHSVRYNKYNDVQKSLVKVARGFDILHDKPARCLDLFFDKFGNPDPRKPIRRQQKSLPPDKHNNRLYAEALALRLNVMASDGYQFPPGFGNLIWDDRSYSICGTDSFNGKTVREILHQIDAFLTCSNNPPKDLTASIYWCVAKALNESFSGCPIDTVLWSCGKLLLKGCRTLKNVPYLHAAPGLVQPYAGFGGPAAEAAAPAGYELRQNYPNPFNPTTTVGFELAGPSLVTLEVYNALGQKVATLLDREELEDGAQEVEFNAEGLASGIYFCRLTVTDRIEQEGDGSFSEGQTHISTRKMLLMK